MTDTTPAPDLDDDADPMTAGPGPVPAPDYPDWENPS